MVRLDDHDRARIAEAVAAAEARSLGEISCVLAHEASLYREVPVFWGAVAALLTPPLGLAIGLDPLALLHGFSDWNAGYDKGGDIIWILSFYALIQAGIFALTLFLVSLKPVRLWLTPGFLKRRRARQSAQKHFATLAARFGEQSPFVLIYAAYDDHRVEIVASDSIHQLTGPTLWEEAAEVMAKSLREGAVAEGYIKAIGIVGAGLARHFPAAEGKTNIMPDRLLEH